MCGIIGTVSAYFWSEARSTRKTSITTALKRLVKLLMYRIMGSIRIPRISTIWGSRISRSLSWRRMSPFTSSSTRSTRESFLGRADSHWSQMISCWTTRSSTNWSYICNITCKSWKWKFWCKCKRKLISCQNWMLLSNKVNLDEFLI